MLDVVLIAFGGFVTLEGLIWAVFPTQMRATYRRMMEEVSDRDLHYAGLLSVFVGCLMLAYGVKRLGILAG